MKEEVKDLYKVDILAVLLDEGNTAPIYIVGEDGERVRYEQIAVIPLEDDRLYCILKPTEPQMGIGEDEPIVFAVKEDGRGSYIEPEGDELACAEVFNLYYDLLSEELTRIQCEETNP